MGKGRKKGKGGGWERGGKRNGWKGEQEKGKGKERRKGKL